MSERRVSMSHGIISWTLTPFDTPPIEANDTAPTSANTYQRLESTEPKIEGTLIKYLGCEMVDDTKDIDIVMIFPMVKKSEIVDKPRTLVEKLFLHHNPDGHEAAELEIIKSRFAFFDQFNDNDPMKKHEFNQKCIDRIVKILSSEVFGLDVISELSIDEDELFVKIKVPDGVLSELADRHEIQMPISPSRYKEVAEAVEREGIEQAEKATDAETRDRRKKRAIADAQRYQCPKIQSSAINGEEKDLPAPMHVRYDKNHKKLYQDFRSVDKIRLVVKRMEDFFKPTELVAHGVMLSMFPVHKWEKVLQFMTRWARISFTGICCGGTSFPDIREVRDYFGEEVVFFFHWLTYLMKMLSIPGIVSVFLLARFPLARAGYIDLAEERYLQMGFATFLMFWASTATAYYSQEMNLAIRTWAMDVAGHIQPVLPSFRAEYRRDWKQTAQNGAHWLIGFLFMVQALYSVYLIQNFRKQCNEADEDETVILFHFIPVPAHYGLKVGKYLITADIKITAFIWSTLSPWLTSKENWRTEAEAKDAQVFKNFMVKAFVYYYPFFYLAFLKEPVEGCGGSPTGCIDVLYSNLVIFFITQVITAMAMILLGVVQARYAITSEIKKAVKGAKTKDKAYKYLQAQSKLPAYPGNTEAYTEFILAFGFITLFGVVCPIMAAAALVSNSIQRQLTAYSLVKVYRRPFPDVTMGIGAWGKVVTLLTYFGAIINVALACFSMHPIKDREDKALIFIAAEHGMLFMMVAVPFFIGSKKLDHLEVDETNADILNELLGDDTSKSMVVPKGNPTGTAKLPDPCD